MFYPCKKIARIEKKASDYIRYIYKWANTSELLPTEYLLCRICQETPLPLHTTRYVCIRCLMASTNQADPSCFYFRISWILVEGRWFYFFLPLHLVQGFRSLKHWLLHKLSMKIFDQKFRFLIKKKCNFVP